MAVLTSTGITFSDSTSQSTATSTAHLGIGSYAVLLNRSNSTTATGSTQAGTSLAYNYDTESGYNVSVAGAGGNSNPFVGTRGPTGSSTNTAGTATSGTWRRMDSNPLFGTFFCGVTQYVWGPGLFVRIS